MNPISLRAGTLLALVLLCAALSPTRPVAASPRTVTFHLGAQCLCAQCAFDAQRALKKLEGVEGVTLNIKQRRLDIVLDESQKPVSSLAAFLAKLDLGQESALLWPTDPKADLGQDARALAQVPGVRSARTDAQAHAVLLTFVATPTVTTAQLDEALTHADAKGSPDHA